MRRNPMLPIPLLLPLLTVPVAASGAAPERVYMVTTMVLSAEMAPGSEPRAMIADGTVAPVSGLALQGRVAQPLGALVVGEVEIVLDGMSVTFDGAAEPDPESGLELLSAPRIVIAAGDEGVVMSGATVQYFEPGDGDCYRLRTLPPEASPALRMAMTVSSGADAGSVSLDLELRLSTVTRREPLPGVELDVGPPVISSRDLRRQIGLRTGGWALVSGHRLVPGERGDDQLLLVLLRVDPR